MGLDMYAHATRHDVGSKQVDLDIPDGSEGHELMYWRKFNRLHGWMEQLYFAKSGTVTDFNCCNLQLTAVDLDKLEAELDEEHMPTTEGFFFGGDEPLNDEHKESVREFLLAARTALDNGLVVYYSAWY